MLAKRAMPMEIPTLPIKIKSSEYGNFYLTINTEFNPIWNGKFLDVAQLTIYRTHIIGTPNKKVEAYLYAIVDEYSPEYNYVGYFILDPAKLNMDKIRVYVLEMIEQLKSECIKKVLEYKNSGVLNGKLSVH